MKVLSISYLFPNNRHPYYGIFVQNRLIAAAKYCKIKVLAPIPWFPFRKYLPGYTDLSNVPSKIKKENIEIYHPRFLSIPRYFKWLEGFFYLLGTIRTIVFIKNKYDFDIVDLHWVYPDIITAYVVSNIFKKPMIVTIRGREAIRYEEVSLRKRIINWFLRKSDHIVCVSNELAMLTKEIGVDQKKISVISNGVNTKAFRPMNRVDCRKKLELPVEKKIILSVGAIIEGKGFHKIVDSFPDLLIRDSNIRLYIIGSKGPAGNYEKELRDQIKRMGLEEHIFLMGSRPNDELVYWYNAADVFCFATSTEGSPNVVLEALACGCPVIASAVGGVPEIICEEFLGKTFDAENKKALEKSLSVFFEKEWDREVIRKYMEKYTWDWCANKVVKRYELEKLNYRR